MSAPSTVSCRANLTPLDNKVPAAFECSPERHTKHRRCAFTFVTPPRSIETSILK